jgi:hypothetical protein
MIQCFSNSQGNKSAENMLAHYLKNMFLGAGTALANATYSSNKNNTFSESGKRINN